MSLTSEIKTCSPGLVACILCSSASSVTISPPALFKTFKDISLANMPSLIRFVINLLSFFSLFFCSFSSFPLFWLTSPNSSGSLPWCFQFWVRFSSGMFLVFLSFWHLPYYSSYLLHLLWVQLQATPGSWVDWDLLEDCECFTHFCFKHLSLC